MAPIPNDSNAERRAAILQSSMGVFMRYGYKKTSMDDLARAAGLSRQGLYLHFASKDELFKEGLNLVAEQGLQALRAALHDETQSIEERLVQAFVALKTSMGAGDMANEHMNELFATALQIAGPRIHDLDQAILVELTEALWTSGVAAKWAGAGLSAEDLAYHLQAASHGVKQQVKSAEEYRHRLGVAVLLVCRADAGLRVSARPQS